MAKKTKQGTRIVGGDETDKAMPWMVLIQTIDEICGSSLINSQFVLTAAHCFCNRHSGVLGCSKAMGELTKTPMVVQNEEEIRKGVKLYVGITKKGGKGYEPHKIFGKKGDDDYHVFPGKKIFIHPLLSSSKEFINTPDQALVMMDGKIEKFSDHVRPICLPKDDTMERPSCPDNSRDKTVKKINSIGESYEEKVRGGCATVAGWGMRFSTKMTEKRAACMTDFSSLGPSKIGLCLDFWKTEKAEYTNCTTDDMHLKDLAEPCRLLGEELKFNKALGIKDKKLSKYQNNDLDEMSLKANAPLEVFWKKKNKKGKKRQKKFKCGVTKTNNLLTLGKDAGKHGWCATKLEKGDTGKIELWGYCNSACQDNRNGFMIANLNILNDDECAELFKNLNKKKNAANLFWNKEYEICTGKKRQFPKSNWRFLRKEKTEKELNKEKEAAKKHGITEFKPTKYKYKFKKSEKPFDSLATPKKYPFDWFLGGVDSCQGDSGGPLWRNVKIDGKVRATQIGTVSRGEGCAYFNAPAIFGSVKKARSWIKETIEKEMGGKGYCPKKS